MIRSRFVNQRPIWSCAGLLSWVCFVALAVSAQPSLYPSDSQRIDVLAIERDDRDLFAFNSLTGRRTQIRLELGEETLFEESRGRIGLVLTDRRALGVTAGSGWDELRYRLNETPPELGLVDDRIAVVVTNRRALGYGRRGVWVEEELSPHESAEALRVGFAVGVVVTNRRALGLATERERFIPVGLQVKESVETVNARDTLVTIRTNRRILVFASGNGSWSIQQRKIN